MPERKDKEEDRGALGESDVTEIPVGAFGCGQPAECCKKFRGQGIWRPIRSHWILLEGSY